MSIKQGDYLKELRVKNNLSQEKLGAELGLSRQSISKWEQGYAMPDTENLLKLSELYGVSVDTILKCGETEEQEEIIKTEETAETVKEETTPENPVSENAEQKPEAKIIFVEKQEHKEKKTHKKRGWFFISYPIWMVALYAAIGSYFGAKGWFTGWIVILTIPLFYTGIIAFEKKKPVIFCYPVLATLVYLMFGFFLNLWHPMWIIFLTIPIFYIVCVTRKIK
ncbi:MAG: helix-turn-helix domain-containing protein [Eubacterium sp.]|nr:helix-turn-helix domain-containing protein [Eubacterium sp.]